MENKHRWSARDLSILNEASTTVELMVLLYAGYLTAGFLETLVYTLEHAPKKYLKKTDFAGLKMKIQDFYKTYDYFWFIYNKPHAYDKYQYAVSLNSTPKQLPLTQIDEKRIPFKKDILDRLTHLQTGVTNIVHGIYSPPF